jgi:hypothetical protein
MGESSIIVVSGPSPSFITHHPAIRGHRGIQGLLPCAAVIQHGTNAFVVMVFVD